MPKPRGWAHKSVGMVEPIRNKHSAEVGARG